MPFYAFKCSECEEQRLIFSPKPIGGSLMKPSCDGEKLEKPHSLAEMERDWQVEHGGHRPGSGFPYVTKHFNGKPIEVTSSLHETSLCKKFNVVKRDDVAWTEDENVVRSFKRGAETISGRGMGLPGVWI